jgi:hypothetical protein
LEFEGLERQILEAIGVGIGVAAVEVFATHTAVPMLPVSWSSEVADEHEVSEAVVVCRTNRFRHPFVVFHVTSFHGWLLVEILEESEHLFEFEDGCLA